jgi:hypothetical protein
MESVIGEVMQEFIITEICARAFAENEQSGNNGIITICYSSVMDHADLCSKAADKCFECLKHMDINKLLSELNDLGLNNTVTYIKEKLNLGESAEEN